MTNTRISTFTVEGPALELYVSDCANCGVIFGIPKDRFANGVCPCCNRSFENVRRHMASQHPEYDATVLHDRKALTFECSCGRSFETLRGLRTHQGHVRPDDWATRGLEKNYWSQRQAHLTVAGSAR